MEFRLHLWILLLCLDQGSLMIDYLEELLCIIFHICIGSSYYNHITFYNLFVLLIIIVILIILIIIVLITPSLSLSCVEIHHSITVSLIWPHAQHDHLGHLRIAIIVIIILFYIIYNNFHNSSLSNKYDVVIVCLLIMMLLFFRYTWHYNLNG